MVVRRARTPGKDRRRLVAHVVKKLGRHRTVVGQARRRTACRRRRPWRARRASRPPLRASRACARTDRSSAAAARGPAVAVPNTISASMTAWTRTTPSASPRRRRAPWWRRPARWRRRRRRRPVGVRARQERLHEDDRDDRHRERQQQAIGLGQPPRRARQTMTRKAPNRIGPNTPNCAPKNSSALFGCSSEPPQLALSAVCEKVAKLWL